MRSPFPSNTKHIFITGGVVSSLGKGVAAASIGRLLVERGFRVTIQKFDPYLNVDPGTMSPFQHGEVFVTEDGAEADLDLGHYERFLDINVTRHNNLTQGRLLWDLLNREREGAYLGKTVQFIPHVTGAIMDAIRALSMGQHVVITEIGGTIGDIESLPFLEAIRQYALDVGRHNVAFVHLSLIPYIATAGEMKTKPTQQTVRQLREIGIQPDMLLCRTEYPIDQEMRQKIALFTNVETDSVIEALDLPSIYDIPLHYRRQDVDGILCRKLGLPDQAPDMSEWARIAKLVGEAPNGEVKIAVVGKYSGYADSYKSVNEALLHAGIANEAQVRTEWISSELWEQGHAPDLGEFHGLLIPGGFGERGVEGMILAIRDAREKGIPFLGICLGMQCAVIEHARHNAGIEGATSMEFAADAQHPVIGLMDEQLQVTRMGGTQRVGSYDAVLRKGSLAERLYGTSQIAERHRHRYEVNNEYRARLEETGLVISGTSPDGTLVEMVERTDHPYFIATQAHPEFKSRPNRAHPLFQGLVSAALERRG